MTDAVTIWDNQGKPLPSTLVIPAQGRLVVVEQAVGFVPALLPHTHFLAEGYWIGGEFDKARETAQQLLELAERCNARGYLGKAHRLLGEVALKTNPDEAEPHFEQTISIFREIKAENELALAYAGYGRLHKQQGNTQQAREYLTKALEILERLGTLLEPDKVRKELDGLKDTARPQGETK